MNKEIKVLGKYINTGFSFNRFAIGFSIDKYHIEIDLVFFWVAIEF
jgi:hypothetical protein